MTGTRFNHLAIVRAVVVLVLCALVTACATTREPIVLTTSFDPQAAAFINLTGRAKVSGQAFVRQNSGKLLRAVGTDVFLVPRTAYADERIAAIYRGRKFALWGGAQMPDADPRYGQHMRTTIASSGGSFSFDRVADGEYYVIAMIHLPSEIMFLQFPIVEKVHVQNGRSIRLVMRGY